MRCAVPGPDAAECVATFDRVEALPDDALTLLEAAGRADFFAGPVWWRTMQVAGLGAGAAPCFVVVRQAGRVVGVWPMQVTPQGMESFGNPYTCLYSPVFASGLGAPGIAAAGAAFGRFCRRFAIVRLDALAQDATLEAWLAGVRAAGLRIGRFAHFGNWHEVVASMGWAAYLHARPGVLRETIRRRMRRAEREAAISYELVRTPEAAEAGIAAYEEVYARSWKVPEPYPRFNPEMMRAAAGIGALRLGILRRAGRPVAVQCWVVVDGVAAVLKLAHDQAEKALSPGTLLSALVIRDLLDGEQIRALDFGRGDDDYKRLWVAQRRQRVGVLLLNPRRLGGMVQLARQGLGALRRRFVQAGG